MGLKLLPVKDDHTLFEAPLSPDGGVKSPMKGGVQAFEARISLIHGGGAGLEANTEDAVGGV